MPRKKQRAVTPCLVAVAIAPNNRIVKHFKTDDKDEVLNYLRKCYKNNNLIFLVKIIDGLTNKEVYKKYLK